MLKSKSQSALIRQPQYVEASRSQYLKRETGPDAGNYEKINTFGSNLGPITIGSKYVTQYD
jgi:hypothetical protein